MLYESPFVLLRFGHLYLTGIRLGVDLKDGLPKGMCLKEIIAGSHNMLTVLGSIVNMIGKTCMIT
jgi:hypothetical protein